MIGDSKNRRADIWKLSVNVVSTIIVAIVVVKMAMVAVVLIVGRVMHVKIV